MTNFAFQLCFGTANGYKCARSPSAWARTAISDFSRLNVSFIVIFEKLHGDAVLACGQPILDFVFILPINDT